MADIGTDLAPPVEVLPTRPRPNGKVFEGLLFPALPTLPRGNWCVRADEYSLNWRRSNPDRIREYNLRLHPVLSMSVEEYDARLESQSGLCMICRRPETRRGSGGKPKRLAIDHNHETLVKRDLLCDDCNNMLGRAHENPEVLRTAALYLERWGK